MKILIFLILCSVAFGDFTNVLWYTMDDNSAATNKVTDSAGTTHLQSNPGNTDNYSAPPLMGVTGLSFSQASGEFIKGTSTTNPTALATMVSIFSTNFAVSLWCKPLNLDAATRLYGYRNLDGPGGNIVDKSWATVHTDGTVSMRYTVGGNANEANAQTANAAFSAAGQVKHLVFVGFKDVTGANGLAIWVNGVRQNLSVNNGDTSNLTFANWAGNSGGEQNRIMDLAGEAIFWEDGGTQVIHQNDFVGTFDDYSFWIFDNTDIAGIQGNLIDRLYNNGQGSDLLLGDPNENERRIVRNRPRY